MNLLRRKELGAYYTPDVVVRSLVCWAVRRRSDQMLDPACGDGRFLAAHANSSGVEQDPEAFGQARSRATAASVHEGDFFAWAAETADRFDCAAGNPPFIRYQRFTGPVRRAALDLCARHGAVLSSLASSWAPFIVGAATLLKPGGRMAFVVPSEIGHARYASAVLDYLARTFSTVQIVAIQRKLFPELSEDCWLLYADGRGGSTDHFLLSPMTQFGFMRRPPEVSVRVPLDEWRAWNRRLRPFLLSSTVRELYQQQARAAGFTRLGDVAHVGIGYVTGANDFFHLRPSQATGLGIPERLLHPSVRNSKSLTGKAVTPESVERWKRRDLPILLLRLRRRDALPPTVRDYLNSPAGREASRTYKCRNRSPWYVVPDVVVPDAFLSCMSGEGLAFVANPARCVGTNSVHVVRLKAGAKESELQKAWRRSFARLSCEVEGHPLGGGMLKLEPREAGRVILPLRGTPSPAAKALIQEGIVTMRRWRHYG